MRLRGFSVMSYVLGEYAADVEICSMVSGKIARVSILGINQSI